MHSNSGTVSSQKKRETHAIFDTLWYILPITEGERAKYRSTLYRVWGAVLAGELDNVDGVRNPSEGGQHIRSMTPFHQEKCQEFIHYLVRSYRGNVTSIAAELSKWSSGFNSDHKNDEAIQQSLNKNVFITNIRQAIGISAYSPGRKKAPIKAASADPIGAAGKSDTVFSVLTDKEGPEIIDNNSEKISAATDSITRSSSIAITKPKEKKLTAAEHFIEGTIAGIEGDIDTMLMHFDHAASKNHAEAAWYMWRYLDETSQSPEKKREALEYLDIACRGLYYLAPIKVKELYYETPSIITPYLEQLQQEARRTDASSTTLNALGEYYTYVLNDIVKGDDCYKQAIEKDDNPDALLNLRALHAAHKEWFFVSEEKSIAYSDYVKSHARTNSKPLFMLERRDLVEAIQQFYNTQNTSEIHQFVTQRMNSGSIAATILYHIGCLNVPKQKKGPRTESNNGSINYLFNITHYSSGSTGDDSNYNIDYTSSHTDKNALLAQASTIPLPTLITYYQKTNNPAQLQYWETYRQCIEEKTTVFPEISEIEKKRIDIFLGSLMGNGVRSASKLRGASFIFTAALLPTIDTEQRERVKKRLTTYNIPFRQEKDGTVLIPEITYSELFAAYSTMMRSHQAAIHADTVPLSGITITLPISHQKDDGKRAPAAPTLT